MRLSPFSNFLDYSRPLPNECTQMDARASFGRHGMDVPFPIPPRRVVMTGRGCRAFPLPLLLAVLATGGCGKSEPNVTPMPAAEKDLGTIAQAFREAYERSNKSPESFEDLRPYLKSLGRAPEDIQVSANDGQPYVVLWGCDPSRGGSSGVQPLGLIVCHEKTGKDGKRAVADTRGQVKTVNEEEFARLRFITKR